MKNTFKFIMALLLAGSTVFYSCETVELEDLANPNNLNPTQSDPNLLLNSVQLAYLSNMGTFNGQASNLTRIEQFQGRNYFNTLISNNSFDATWSRIYATANGDTRGMIPNIQAIEDLNTSAGDGSLNYQEGVGKALLAHNLMLLVDFIGEVPFSQANNPDMFPAPQVDAGADVYASALGLLNEAQTLLTGSNGTDLFFNTGAIGNGDAWIKFINTVRLKAAITTGDLSTFDSIIAGDNFISSTADDFQYQYIANDVNPDGRHPEYANDYTPSGANIYQSNWLMKQMNDSDDPRIRYYFYRQTDCTPGASCNPDPEGTPVTQLTCSIQEPPQHYIDLGFADSFCFLEDGYWGRPHGDNQGVPPDNFFRTASGVYPAAGRYDDESFGNVGFNDPVNSGGGGAGIEPFILASYVDFWRAERAMDAGNTGAARGFIMAGLEKSISKVRTFGALDVTRNTEFDVVDEDQTEFIDDILADFDGGSDDDKMNILAEQNWVTQFGGGAETYNFYRRTGFPTTLTPVLEPNPGPFPRSFPYSSEEVAANPNINQKGDLNGQVFWDNNPASAVNGGFPFSN